MEFKATLKQYQQQVEQALDLLLPPANTRPARIHEAMRYSLDAGGKRLRPTLVLLTAELFGSSADQALPAAVAIECIHTYSLIHDDLPAMDNSELRRGKPTNHIQFDEPTAILAGDALLTYAFELLAKHYCEDASLATALVLELAKTSGSTQLIGGQMEDILGERSQYSEEQIEFIHLNKTAALLATSFVMGALVAHASPEQIAVIRDLGTQVGLAFQVTDDLLDATSDSATIGKTVGQDAAADKSTFIGIVGLDGARQRARELTDRAVELYQQLPAESPFLLELIRKLEHRSK